MCSQLGTSRLLIQIAHASYPVAVRLASEVVVVSVLAPMMSRSLLILDRAHPPREERTAVHRPDPSWSARFILLTNLHQCILQ